jgi:RNA polymerase sigma factor (sigma-70 family)
LHRRCIVTNPNGLGHCTRLGTDLRLSLEPAGGRPPATTAREVDEVVSSEAEARALREALAVLSPDERQAIEISYFSELTYSEVAAQLNHPVGTVKTRIRSGLGKLRKALSSRERDQ